MQTFVDEHLAARLEAGLLGRAQNYARAYRSLHPEAEVAIQELAGGQLLYLSPGSPLNRAIGLGFERPLTAPDLAAIEEFYHSRQSEVRVDLCPLADSSLLYGLARRGYVLERFFNLLFTPLDQADIVHDLPAGMRIERMTGEDAALWLRTTAQGFEETDQPGAEIFNILAPNFYAENAVCFLAYVDGEPAGGGGLYVHQGVAELGGASTRPAFRRMGVQTALLRARLTAAQEMGCEFAIVMTTPGSNSQRNIQRAGLRLAYTRAVLRANPG